MNTPPTTPAAHTPGPWRFFTDTKHGPWDVQKNKPGNPWYYQWWIESDTRKLMALLEVPYLSTTVEHSESVKAEHAETLAEVAANAALIASAPALAAENAKLRAALEAVSRLDYLQEHNALAEMVRKALSR